jgi:predicted Zn-dependent protease
VTAPRPTSRTTFDALVSSLTRRDRGLGDWSARWRQVERAEATTGAGSIRLMSRGEIGARVHVDAPTGRGSADLAIAAAAPPDSIERWIEQAVARAVQSIGPGWRAPSPSAPARVELDDRQLAIDPATAHALAAQLEATARSHGAEVVGGRIAVERARVAIATGRGLAARWVETRIDVDAVIAVAGVTATVTRAARRRRDLDLGAAVAAAATAARDRERAGETPPGPRPILVPASALGGAGAAILSVLAELADAALHRRGLAPVRVGAEIAAGAAAAAEPLSVASDGTWPFGLGSVPIGDRGEPVRRFAIVERGRLTGLALDETEGALSGAPANGGVRNLTIGDGASTAAALRGDGVLEVREISHVDLEPIGGRVAFGIGLGFVHDGGTSRPVTGREVQGDLLAALARSRRTRGIVTAGAYRGPELIQLPDLVVV